MWNQINIMLMNILLFIYCLSFAGTVYAIPSPDLVINIFASIGQLLAILSLILGRVFFTFKRQKSKKAKASPWPMRLTLGSLVVAIISLGLYHNHQIEVKNKRLQANIFRSSTEAGKKVGDTSLKTLSFSQQLNHPQGLSTKDLSVLIDEGKDINIIDVRELEETESGKISSASHHAYPNLLHSPQKILKKDKKNILLCFSGNRSGELCTKMEKLGYPCKFVVGGYEKWMSENKPIYKDGQLVDLEDNDNLRGLPDFMNKEVLLDTPDV